MFKTIVFGFFLVSFQLNAQDVAYLNVGKAIPELNSYKVGRNQLDSLDVLQRALIDSMYRVPWSCTGYNGKEYIEKWYEEHRARWYKKGEELDSLGNIYLEIINENIRNELNEFCAQFCSAKQITFLVADEVYYGTKPEDVTEEFIRFICPSDR